MALQKTPIVDKNGKHTTVHKKVEGSDDVRVKNAPQVTAAHHDMTPADTESIINNARELSEIPKEVFDTTCTPQNIYENAGRIYEFIAENGGEPDSVAREALFTYASNELDIKYGKLYSRWMNGYIPESDNPAQPETKVEETPNAPLPLKEYAIEMLEVTPEKFAESFTPKAIYENAGRIYEFIGENGGQADSAGREAIFDYAAQELNVEYEELYQKWMNG